MDKTSKPALWIRLFAIVNGALVALLIGAALLGESGVVRHERLNEELRRVRALNHDIERENARLRAQARALKGDPAFLEAVIRDELGWAREDELVFLFSSDEKEGTPSPR